MTDQVSLEPPPPADVDPAAEGTDVALGPTSPDGEDTAPMPAGAFKFGRPESDSPDRWRADSLSRSDFRCAVFAEIRADRACWRTSWVVDKLAFFSHCKMLERNEQKMATPKHVSDACHENS